MVPVKDWCAFESGPGEIWALAAVLETMDRINDSQRYRGINNLDCRGEWHPTIRLSEIKAVSVNEAAYCQEAGFLKK